VAGGRQPRRTNTPDEFALVNSLPATKLQLAHVKVGRLDSHTIDLAVVDASVDTRPAVVAARGSLGHYAGLGRIDRLPATAADVGPTMKLAVTQDWMSSPTEARANPPAVVTTSGVSGLIDPYGQVVMRDGVADLPLRTGTTPASRAAEPLELVITLLAATWLAGRALASLRRQRPARFDSPADSAKPQPAGIPKMIHFQVAESDQ